MSTEKTAIQQLIEEIKANMAGVGVSSNESGVSKIQQQWYQASYSTMSRIVLDLEVNYLEIEKNQIRRAFNQGGKWASEISSEDYYNQDYTQSSE